MGGVAEWFMALVLKTSWAKALTGSNPVASARYPEVLYEGYRQLGKVQKKTPADLSYLQINLKELLG